MATRRMFSLRVINSARFLKMPISTQALYFHLGLNADDDGVVEAFNVVRSVGCSEDDLRVLASKGFIKILNEDLVTYIMDWTENNRIRADRKVDSIYKDLLISMLPNAQIVEKKARADAKKPQEIAISEDMDNQRTTNGQPTDNQRTTNGQPTDGIGKDRIGKDRIVEDSIGEDRVVEDRSGKEINIYQQVADMYNDTCVSFPRVTTLSDSRKKAIKARLRIYRLEDFKKVFEKVETSDFLRGSNDRNWNATFDWILKDSNFAKILEGNYDNRGRPRNNTAAGLDQSYNDLMRWAEGDG